MPIPLTFRLHQRDDAVRDALQHAENQKCSSVGCCPMHAMQGPCICLVNFCLNLTLTFKILLCLRRIRTVILPAGAPRIPQPVEEEDVASGSLQHIPNILKHV